MRIPTKISIFTCLLFSPVCSNAGVLPSPSEHFLLKDLIEIKGIDIGDKEIDMNLNNQSINRYFPQECLLDISVSLAFFSDEHNEFIKNAFVLNFQYKTPTYEDKNIFIASIDSESRMQLSIGLSPISEQCEGGNDPRSWYFEFENYDKFLLFAKSLY